MTSQLGQDAFVLGILQNKTEGFFVEFGACDGILFSNTLLLEKSFGWKGILAEPAYYWQTSLQYNRKCNIDFRAVWPRSNESIMFCETQRPELSTDALHVYGDSHESEREKASSYRVITVSLDDLLQQYGAKEIDYLSIDTEGSEFEILESFSWRIKPKIITVEHNYRPQREKIFDLLTENGYARAPAEQSKWDDWYRLI